MTERCISRITIVHVEPGAGRCLVCAVISMTDGTSRDERFSAPDSFASWAMEDRVAFVREMMERRMMYERRVSG